MATTKFATIRYQALDRCFSNHTRQFDINGLVDACNEAISEYDPRSLGVVKRTVYEDIRFMQSEQGWSIDLEKYKVGKNVYYRYTDPKFTINRKPLNESEVLQLKETLSILSRFQGIEQFEWMEDVKIKMETMFNQSIDNNPVVSFEHNPYLKGLEHFTNLLNAIQARTVLIVQYQGYNQPEPVKMTIHPYHLKQYNNRWFLFGLNNDRNEVSSLALDRIHDFKPSKTTFIDSQVDFSEYFDDVIGVTVKKDAPTEKIMLRVSNDRWVYVASKPLHHSQKKKHVDADGTIIQLDVQINKELVNTILSFGPDITVMEPKALRELVIDRIKGMHGNYFNV